MKYPMDKLGSHIDILSGFAFKSSDFIGSGIPVIKIKNITPPSVTLEDLSFVSEEIAEQQTKFILNYDDVLIALTGSHINQMASVVGRVARVKYNVPSLLNQRVGKITVLNPAESNIDYIYYYLSQDSVKIKLASKAGGAANQANISPTDIKNLIIPFPDIAIQNKIACILSAYDNLIESNQKQIKLLEEAAQRLYKEWFIDLRFPGHESTPIHDGIPEGWERTTVGGVCSLRKKSLSPDMILPGTPYIGLEHIPRKDFCLSTWGDSSEITSNKYEFCKDDIIFGQIRPYFHKVGFAIVDGVASTDSFIMTPQEQTWGLFLMTVSSEAFVNYAYQTCKEGAKMPRADWNQMKKYQILVANKDIQTEFEGFIKSVTRRVSALAHQSKHLAEARDRLLPKLMSGEIEV